MLLPPEPLALRCREDRLGFPIDLSLYTSITVNVYNGYKLLILHYEHLGSVDDGFSDAYLGALSLVRDRHETGHEHRRDAGHDGGC